MPRVTGPTSHEAIRRSLKSKFKLILSENKILVQIINGYVRQAEKLCRDLESAGDVTPKEFSKGMARLETVYSACVKLILMASELFEQDEKPKPRPVESTACESDSVGTNGTITYTEPHRPTPCPIDKDTKERLRALEDKLQEFESKQHKDLPEESLPTNLEKTQDDKVIDEPDLKNGGAGVDADGFIELERFLKELDKEYPMANSVSAKIITETAEKQETSTATSSCTSEGPAKPQLCPDANNSDLQDRFENLLIAVQSLAESCQGEGSVMKALTELRQLIQRQAEPGSVPEIKDSTPKKESVSFGFSPSPCFAYVNEDFTVDSSNDKFGNPRIAVFQTPMDIPPLEQKARFGENKKNCGPPQKQQQQPAWLSSDRFQLSRQKAKMCQPCVEQTNEKIPSLQHYSVQKYQQSEQEKKSEQQTESYRKQVFPSQNQEPAVSQPYSRQEVTDIMVNEMSEVLCSQFVPRLEVKYLERQVASVDSTDKFTRITDDCNRFAAHPNVPVKTPRSHSLEGRGISNNLARQSQKKQINTIDTEHMENVMSIPGTGHRNVHLHSTQKGGCGPCHDYYLPNMENQTQQTQRPPLPRSYLVQKQQRQETHYQQPECLHGPLQDHHQQIRTQQQQVRQQQQQQQKQQHQQPQQQHHHQQLQQYQQQQQQQQHQLQQTRFTERAPPHEQHQWQKLCDHANKPSKLNYTLESNDVNCQDCEFHQHAPFEPHQLRQQQGHPYHEQQYRMAQACNNQQRMQNHITQDILDFDSTFPGVGSGEYIFQTMNVPLSTVYDSHGQTQSSRNSRLHDSFPPSYNDDSQSDYPTPNFYDPGTLPRPHSSYPKKNNPCATYGGQNSQVKTSTTEKSMVAPHADLHINPPPNCPCKAVRVDTHEDKDALKVPETRDSDREQDTPCSNIQQLSSEDHGASSNSEERPREVCGEMQSDNVPAEDKKAHGETRMKMYMDQQATLLPMRKEKIRGHSTGVSINATKSKGINETRTICITNLPFKMEEMRLLELLKQYGHVTKIYFIKHRHTGIFQGITYVKFSKQTEAVQAAQGLNKLIFDGNEIFAHLHTSKTPTVNESFRDS